MRNGSTTLGEATAALAGDRRSRRKIARNLCLLVAAGALMPFARPFAPRAAAGDRLASAVVERALANVIEARRTRAIPCDVLGNGVELQPIDAMALREWVAGARVRGSCVCASSRTRPTRKPWRARRSRSGSRTGGASA